MISSLTRFLYLSGETCRNEKKFYTDMLIRDVDIFSLFWCTRESTPWTIFKGYDPGCVHVVSMQNPHIRFFSLVLKLDKLDEPFQRKTFWVFLHSSIEWTSFKPIYLRKCVAQMSLNKLKFARLNNLSNIDILSDLVNQLINIHGLSKS